MFKLLIERPYFIVREQESSYLFMRRLTSFIDGISLTEHIVGAHIILNMNRNVPEKRKHRCDGIPRQFPRSKFRNLFADGQKEVKAINEMLRRLAALLLLFAELVRLPVNMPSSAEHDAHLVKRLHRSHRSLCDWIDLDDSVNLYISAMWQSKHL